MTYMVIPLMQKSPKGKDSMSALCSVGKATLKLSFPSHKLI